MDIFISFCKYVYRSETQNTHKNSKTDTFHSNIFPIGIWRIKKEGNLKILKDIGFNLIFYGSQEVSELNEFKKLDLYTLQYIKFERVLKHDPQIYGYYLYDEPGLRNDNEKLSLRGISRNKFIKRLQNLHLNNRPTILSLIGVHTPIYLLILFKNLLKYSKLADIYIANTYPISRFMGPIFTINYANKLLKIFNPNRTIFSNIQAFKFYRSPSSLLPWIWSRYPTSRELEAMIYHSIASGSRGILFFNADRSPLSKDPFQGILFNKELLDKLKDIIAEMKIIIPYLKNTIQINLKNRIRPNFYQLSIWKSGKYLILFILNSFYLQGFKDTVKNADYVYLKLKLPDRLKNFKIYHLNRKINIFKSYRYNKNTEDVNLFLTNPEDVNVLIIEREHLVL
jgi:hypothetical protein